MAATNGINSEYFSFLETEMPRIEASSQKYKKASRWFTLLHAMDCSKPLPNSDGLWLEFGVFNGESIALMAAHPNSPPVVC